MMHMTETVSHSDVFCARVLENFSETYKIAHSPILEGETFSAFCMGLGVLSNALSDMLMPISEYPALIAEFLPDDSPGLDMARRISMASERMGDLNQHLIRLCHGHEGQPSTVDLALLAHEVLSDLLPHLDIPNDVQLELEIDDQPSTMRGLYDALYHMVRDMCLNAVHNLGTAGRFTIRVGTLGVEPNDPLHVRGIPGGSHLLLQFRDSGPGIAPSCRDTLFDPFVTTSSSEGRGLGLCSVYRTVRHHEGSILYNPDGASGSDFLLLFPRESA